MMKLPTDVYSSHTRVWIVLKQRKGNTTKQKSKRLKLGYRKGSRSRRDFSGNKGLWKHRSVCKTSLPRTPSTLTATAGDMHCYKQRDSKIQVRCVSPLPYSPSAETILWLSAKWRTNFKTTTRQSSLQLSVIVETQWMGTYPASWANFTLAGWKIVFLIPCGLCMLPPWSNLSCLLTLCDSLSLFTCPYQFFRIIFLLPISGEQFFWSTCLCQNTGSPV